MTIENELLRELIPTRNSDDPVKEAYDRLQTLIKDAYFEKKKYETLVQSATLAKQEYKAEMDALLAKMRKSVK